MFWQVAEEGITASKALLAFRVEWIPAAKLKVMGETDRPSRRQRKAPLRNGDRRIIGETNALRRVVGSKNAVNTIVRIPSYAV